MGAIDEVKKINKELAEDEELISISRELDIAEDFAMFRNSEGGKSMVEKLKQRIVMRLNLLFDISKEPKLENLLSCIAGIETDMKLLHELLGAKENADAMLSIFTDKLKEKNK
ncbi:MAG TPA: hypothetical protein PK698_06395 [Bacilli bacterium]|nr:hypothetical protein [Bacilli bacterium]